MNTNHGPRHSIGTKDTDGHTASLKRTRENNYGTDIGHAEFISVCHAISQLYEKLGVFQTKWSSFVIKDYLKVLKLFPVACRYGW